jgi:hypothetical protein
MPNKMIKAITGLQRDLIWGGLNNEEEWDLVPCDRIWLPKSLRGLEIRDLQVISRAMGGKRKWRLLKGKNDLWGNVLRDKYGIVGDRMMMRTPEDDL